MVVGKEVTKEEEGEGLNRREETVRLVMEEVGRRI
jgi:hypothetical protein